LSESNNKWNPLGHLPVASIDIDSGHLELKRELLLACDLSTNGKQMVPRTSVGVCHCQLDKAWIECQWTR